MNKYLCFLVLPFFLACIEKDRTSNFSKAENEALFTVLSDSITGITFLNDLKENTYMNGLFYEYYYNGGGVAVADFNNDGRQDIYFVNTLKDNSLYLNDGDMKFRDVTKISNAAGGYGFGTGVTLVDINNDGLMDIYYCKSGKISDPDKRKNELLINMGMDSNGIPKFENKASDYNLDFSGFSTQAAFFDYDRDGDLDMFLINHGIELYDDRDIAVLKDKGSQFRGERLFENKNGKFTDVTEKAGIINNMLGFGLGISIGDLNNDGWPDVYVGNDFSEKDHLYINNKNGTFNEVSLSAFGHISNFSMGNDIADINNDGFFDVLALDMMAEDNYTQKTSMSGMNPQKFYDHVNLGLHHQYMYNTLQLNRGVKPDTDMPMFSDVAQLAGISSTDWSWAPLIFDMNNNGNKDIFISNGIKRDFRNNDFVRYRKKKQEEVKENQSIDPVSYVNDMLGKMPYRQKKNYFYINGGQLSFQKIELEQPETNSNGAAYADFDNDGDLDIVVNNSSGLSFLYENNSIGNNYFKINLKGNKNNIDAIGSRVIIFTENGEQYADKYYTRGFQSAMADKIHFGLGELKVIDSVKVIWPDGTFAITGALKANQEVTFAYDEALHKSDNQLNLRSTYLFSDATEALGVDFVHKENEFDDFKIETLLPHRMSRLGPALTVADVNGDGLDDFFIGGAKGQGSALYLQTKTGKFEKDNRPFAKEKSQEDVGAIFFDADGDGDQDLYVVSGGTEMPSKKAYNRDRLYENIGNGNFILNKTALPNVDNNGLSVSVGDYDNDGDLDLFVGERSVPGKYGRPTRSYLLNNNSTKDKISFEDVTSNIFPGMKNHPMVAASVWTDINKNGMLELIIANEWGPMEIFEYNGESFVDLTTDYNLSDQVGWWSSIQIADIDKDGDMDIIAGNLGKNYKYKASEDAPFYMYVNDFDQNGIDDIVLGYKQDTAIFPVRGRQCSSAQMPFIKKEFESYDAFGKADVQDIYGEKLKEAISYRANQFASSIFINENGTFEIKPLDVMAQLSSTNEILYTDFDQDGKDDLLLLGNLYSSEVETPRNDASYGTLLLGDNSGNFSFVPNDQINLWENGDVKGAQLIEIAGQQAVLIAKNNAPVRLLLINKNQDQAIAARN